jgi:hypothetical protein
MYDAGDPVVVASLYKLSCAGQLDALNTARRPRTRPLLGKSCCGAALIIQSGGACCDSRTRAAARCNAEEFLPILNSQGKKGRETERDVARE